MPLVPAVTELIVAELLYVQYKDRTKPIFFYINSTGTTRADGETVRMLTSADDLQSTILTLGRLSAPEPVAFLSCSSGGSQLSGLGPRS